MMRVVIMIMHRTLSPRLASRRRHARAHSPSSPRSTMAAGSAPSPASSALRHIQQYLCDILRHGRVLDPGPHPKNSGPVLLLRYNYTVYHIIHLLYNTDWHSIYYDLRSYRKVFPYRLPQGSALLLTACGKEAKNMLSLAACRPLPFRGRDFS